MRKHNKDMRHFYLVETEKGNNYLVATTPSAGFSALQAGDRETKRTKLDITFKEHVALLNKAITHTLSFDEAGGRIIAKPRIMKTNTPPDNNIQPLGKVG